MILSPTPPVECLSVVERGRSVKSSRSPEHSIASVHRLTSARVMPRHTIAMFSAAICSSAMAPCV